MGTVTGWEAMCTEDDVFISGGRLARARKNVIIVTLDGREKRKRIKEDYFLCGLALWFFRSKRAIAATKVVGAVAHEKGGELGINAVG
jgi:hypothetical protein